jgi:hypothetical protein
MSKSKQTSIEVQGTAIAIVSVDNQDFISLTDMAEKFGDDVLIYSWMRNRNTLEFIGIWEQLHNPDFKGIEFETFRNQAGLNSFSLTPRKWIEATGAIGFQSRAGRYGGGTYAHKDIAKDQASLVYASEADLLNVALFGQVAKQWRDAHPEAEGNIRDHATLEQLVVLTNLESLNSVLIRQGLPQSERLLKLNEIAITQMRTLLSDNNIKRLK